MARPTIRDLAAAAGVSTATVNRALAGSSSVRPETLRRVLETSESLGFYGVGALRARSRAARPRRRFGFVLHQPWRLFYQNLAAALRAACAACEEADIEARIEFLEDLSPSHIGARMLALGRDCAALGVVAAVHPSTTEALEALRARGIPVFGLLSALGPAGQGHYVGLDSWRLGRTAAWAMSRMARRAGEVAILVGNHRYRCQDMSESGFRSYFREHAPDFTVLEALSTYEASAVAQDLTERLLRERPCLAGLYMAGGGVTGVIAALRAAKAPEGLVVIGHELTETTRQALLEGHVAMLLSHPLERLAAEAVAGMLKAVEAGEEGGMISRVLPFDIQTRENI